MINFYLHTLIFPAASLIFSTFTSLSPLILVRFLRVVDKTVYNYTLLVITEKLSCRKQGIGNN